MPDTLDFIPGPETARHLRDAMGRFATGVTVITTRGADGPVGITANSFASLSLDPPLVLWAPGKFSRRFAYFVDAAHFAIHVLGADQAALGRHFARKGFDFDLPGVTESDAGTPLLQGCLARFYCALEASHDAGDHAIVVGRVLHASLRAGDPLVFSQGRFGGFSAAD